jgi:hypothetical protein
MQRISIKTITAYVILSALAISAAYVWTTQQDKDMPSVTIAQYNTHVASSDLEGLHRIQIDDIAGLRQNLESAIANDVNLLWSSIQDGHTSTEDRTRAYGMLRLIAVQDEKFPIQSLNSDPKITAILQAAVKNDLTHTKQLRRQDWSQPKWTHWVK